VAYFTYAYSPILDDDGNVGGVLLVTHETTARVLAERRMGTLHQLTEMTRDASTVQQACEQASRALTSGPDVPFVAIYLGDAHERRLSCVAACAGGRSVEPAVPRLALEAGPNGSGSGIVATADAGGGLIEAEALIAPSDRNGPLPRRALVAPIGADAGGPSDGIAIVGLSDDVPFDDSYRSFVQIVVQGIARTVARARARELEQRQRDSIAALDQAKSALLSNVSHELRTPLALILGQLEQVLEADEVRPPQRESLTIAQRSAMRMLKLVGALLDFSRLEAGEHAGEFQPTDLPQLTRDVAAMFRSTAERAGLRLVLDCPPMPARVYIDRDAWERILANLLSNAIKFTPAGEIRVRTSLEGEEVGLAVEDTGIGIAPEELGRIFSRFYRAGDARARSHQGVASVLRSCASSWPCTAARSKPRASQAQERA
jgi:signal transduction histidine kinase